MKKICLLIVSLLLLVGCGKDDAKELVCTMTPSGSSTISSQKIIATYQEDKLINIEMTVKTKIPDKNMASVYVKSLKENAEKNYKDTDSVSVNAKADGDEVSLITNINYRTFTDNDAKVVAIDKDTSYNDLKKRFENIGYTCK